MIGIVSLILLFMWALFFFALFSENSWFVFIASAGLILISVYMMSNGLESVDNFVTKGIAVIQIGIGMIGIFAPLFDEIES